MNGVAIAVTILTAWTAHLAFLLSRPALEAVDFGWALPAVAVQTFLFTGLFITAHDAMHGTVAPSRKRLNDAIGTLAVGLYALFSYRKLREKHAEHHARPGHPEADPDFHDGRSKGFVRWYLRFVLTYVSVVQVVGMAVVFNILAHVVGVPEHNLLLFWVAPSLLSTVQLFTFGTYLPHREPHDPRDPHRARSSGFPPWLSFLTCYHFGYHHEHHEHPGIPWWRLPSARQASSR